jgi:hypothetical protein
MESLSAWAASHVKMDDLSGKPYSVSLMPTFKDAAYLTEMIKG